MYERGRNRGYDKDCNYRRSLCRKIHSHEPDTEHLYTDGIYSTVYSGNSIRTDYRRGVSVDLQKQSGLSEMPDEAANGERKGF